MFIGEEAQDAGGPLWEYFRLLWRDIANDGCLFAGSEEGHVLTHNMLSLQNGDFALVGRCIGMALLYGGSGPHFFSESVTSYIFNEPIDYSVRSDIPDYDIREKIDKVGQYIFILLHASVHFIVQYVEPPTTYYYPKHKPPPYNNTSQSVIIILLYFNL